MWWSCFNLQLFLKPNCTLLYLNFTFDLLPAVGVLQGGGAVLQCYICTVQTLDKVCSCKVKDDGSCQSFILLFLTAYQQECTKLPLSQKQHSTFFNNNMVVTHSDLELYHPECVCYGCFNVRSSNWRPLMRRPSWTHTRFCSSSAHSIRPFYWVMGIPQVHCKMASPSIRQFP